MNQPPTDPQKGKNSTFSPGHDMKEIDRMRVRAVCLECSKPLQPNNFGGYYKICCRCYTLLRHDEMPQMQMICSVCRRGNIGHCVCEIEPDAVADLGLTPEMSLMYEAYARFAANMEITPEMSAVIATHNANARLAAEKEAKRGEDALILLQQMRDEWAREDAEEAAKEASKEREEK